MENRNQLLDASIEKVMTDIEQTRREDMVVAANKVRLAPAQAGEAIAKMESAIRTAVKTAFDKNLYLSYRETLQQAANIKIDEGGEHDLELFAKQIGRVCSLTESEHKAVAQRMLETGDRSLFGIQAALTDEAKYAKNYDRKLELERAGGKIFTEIPRRWKTIQNLVAAEKLTK